MTTVLDLPKSFRGNMRHRGVAIVYIAVAMVTLVALSSLAVDLARVQTVKNELHHAADAASRYGAMGLPTSPAAAIANAITSAADNTADGSAVVVLPQDVVVGNWNTALSPQFSATRTPMNAVKVSCTRSAARGTATPLMFAQVLGNRTCDVTVSSISAITSPNAVNLQMTVNANSNPWLSGEASGTQASVGNPHNNPDTASVYTSSQVQQGLQYYLTTGSGTASLGGVYNWSGVSTISMSSLGSSANWVPSGGGSPQVALGLPLTAGSGLTFTSISGNANFNGSTPAGTADGDTTYVLSDMIESEHGMSNITAPIDSLVGVFLDDTTPDSSAAPPDLDFSTDASRNFTSIKPQLKQMFFIGDGLNNAGNAQQFVVPQGATRLFFGNMDGYEWSNDVGSFSVAVHSPVTVSTVQ